MKLATITLSVPVETPGDIKRFEKVVRQAMYPHPDIEVGSVHDYDISDRYTD